MLRDFFRAEFFFYGTKILTLMLCNYNNYLFMERYTSFDDLIFDGEFIVSWFLEFKLARLVLTEKHMESIEMRSKQAENTI